MQRHPELKVVKVCAWLGMSAQNYYARRQQRRHQEVEAGLVLELVRSQRQHQPRLGGRKLYYLLAPELRAAGVKMGRDRLFEELSKAGLLVEKKPSLWPKTTHFDASLPVFRNLVRGRQATGPNQIWVADITYIRTREAFLFLGLITDQWSRKIVGSHLGETLETHHVLKALARALKSLGPGHKPIHHSDRGCQYASHAYVSCAQRAGLKMSMTEKNHSAENALAERVNGILKQEYYLDSEFADRQQASQATALAIVMYNTRRPHSALGFLTPEQKHNGLGAERDFPLRPALRSGSLRSPALRAGRRGTEQKQQRP